MGSRRALRAHGRVQPLASASAKSTNPKQAGISKAARRGGGRVQRKAAILAAARTARIAIATQPPLLVALLSASAATDDDLSRVATVLRTAPQHNARQRFDTLIVRRDTASQRDVLIAALDAAKVADLVLLVFKDLEDELDLPIAHVLTAMREQGMPSLYPIAIGKGADDPALRKLRGRQLSSESLGSDHALRPIRIECGDREDADQVNMMAARRIFGKRPRIVSWRSKYGYLNIESATTEKVGEKDCFTIRGWVRGRGFSANELVHLTGFGSFAAHQIVEVASGAVLSSRNDSEAEPVGSEAEIDDIMGEQTWPPDVSATGDDEEEHSDAERLAAEYDDGADDVEEAEEDGNNEQMHEMQTEGIDSGPDEDDENEDEMSVDEGEAQKMREAAKDDALFPDEVDTPVDQAARVRFARYRGLKSFRTGEWDPKEQLPKQYATLFQFRNLAATKKRVLAQARKEAEKASSESTANFVCSGRNVTLQLLSVPVAVQEEVLSILSCSSRPLVASGMLRHENRRSVVHFGLQRVDDERNAVDIKAKSHLELHCGFVRFDGCPMFSEHNANTDKHKMERFLKHGRYTVASFYGPAIFAPAPALLCHPGGALIATGTSLGADPDRIMLKRILLTGYPFKTQKRRTVVKFMFFNPEDIRWFKPVELWTKMGRSGHILEPVGTHGHMKCIFDNVILHHDTVCMTLYKRVYPKFVEQTDEHKQSM